MVAVKKTNPETNRKKINFIYKEDKYKGSIVSARTKLKNVPPLVNRCCSRVKGFNITQLD